MPLQALPLVLALLATSVAPPTQGQAAQPPGPQPDWADLNLALVQGHLVPRYRVLAQATRNLAAGLDAFCAAPDEAGLNQARGRFVAALDAWNGIAHMRFGPIETDQRFYRFQVWPDKRGTGAKQVRQLLAEADPARLEPAALARDSVAVQGLSALELLLYPHSEVTLADFQAEGGAGFRCRFAAAIGRNLAGLGQATLADWTQGEAPYAKTVLEPGIGQGRFADPSALGTAVLMTLNTGAQVVHELKLREPLGPGPTAANPRKAEAWRSRRSLANVCTNLRALGHLYATALAPRLAGLWLPETDQGLALTLAAAQSACLSLPPEALDEAPGPDRPDARQALEHLRDLAGALQARTGKRLAEELDLTLGFNSLDGD